MSILSWLFGENKVVRMHLKAPANPKRQYDSLVGEPVISFINSMEETPKRYLIKNISVLSALHSGEENLSIIDKYEMRDTKTEDVYEAYFNNRTGQICLVRDLPFELNTIELRTLSEAFKNRRLPAQLRRAEMEASANERARLTRRAKEASSRAEFSKRFQ